jgi:hypothetical protein
MENEVILQPECYKRHAEIEGHIKEGKFWRGTIVTAAISFMVVLIAQYNMSIQNNEKIISANAKLTNMVEINTVRLNRIEAIYFK